MYVCIHILASKCVCTRERAQQRATGPFFLCLCVCMHVCVCVCVCVCLSASDLVGFKIPAFDKLVLAHSEHIRVPVANGNATNRAAASHTHHQSAQCSETHTHTHTHTYTHTHTHTMARSQILIQGFGLSIAFSLSLPFSLPDMPGESDLELAFRKILKSQCPSIFTIYRHDREQI